MTTEEVIVLVYFNQPKSAIGIRGLMEPHNKVKENS
ncbi:hypothetical protein Bhyg_04077 [Pseudolycoriella hygida]|uniref:Uncharacterized protein n=1 Tax=Pseudolycoriella hygida TaxID=35572 RepID=A0A9Q0S9U5_9DIPT|nr:hypothetical protein Bhyg_04077 [Pseudolycoriella hygida]